MKKKMKKELICNCKEGGCICKRVVVVPNYVDDNSNITCNECSCGRHVKPKTTKNKKTNMSRPHKDMFVQSSS